MLRHLVKRPTYQFYEFYYMMWNRGDASRIGKLMKNNYYVMYLVMNYIKYTDIYERVRNYCVYMQRQIPIYEETIEVVDDSITGLRITYEDDPVECVKKNWDTADLKTKCNITLLLYCAINFNHHNVLIYFCGALLLLWKCKPSAYFMCIASARGNMECNRILYENGCRHTPNVCSYTCNHHGHNGHISVTTHLGRKGWEIDEEVCVAIITSDKSMCSECVRFVYDNPLLNKGIMDFSRYLLTL